MEKVDWTGVSAMVQAGGAAATEVATVVLVCVTRRYVKLTGELVEASRKSIEAAFMPQVACVVSSADRASTEISFNLHLENYGPLRWICG
ncbi:hypothetical protein [Geochorda subterranea]|uniref:Uncharacterized protein n=1 Tax=Geochorda subterranea TaxID=3109564 RepID=A0ABZ1BPT4_9FIRM|nr:hypothetical protein [Limnochorda sp. LNt]WRP14595.1 hypothetical protein VLY81_00030 [Limnochorda sp. LNt]